MRLRRMRHLIDVQLCDPRLRIDQDEKRSVIEAFSTWFVQVGWVWRVGA
jgi:hypothetical protein